MKIRKESLFHKFLFYLDEPPGRPDEEDILVFFLRCAAMTILIPVMSLIAFVGSSIAFEEPLYFWIGHAYRDPLKLKRIAHLYSRRKYLVFRTRMLIGGLCACYSAMYFYWTILPKVNGWIENAISFTGKNYKLILFSLVVMIFLWIFRKHLPKIKYID